MPQLTFTADSTTDQLASTAHGLNTGDGPATMYTVAGVLPTFSPAILALADAWIIRIDANHVKLATTQANALAGTAADCLTNGSGTLLLLIGVPYRRPRTYAAGSQLASADVNAWDDTFVAIWNLLTGQAQTIWNGITLASAQHLAVLEDRVLQMGPRLATVTSGTPGFALSNTNFTGSGAMFFDLPLRSGDVIKSYILNFGGDNTVDVILRLTKITPPTGGQVIVDSTTFTNVASGSFTALSVNPADQLVGPHDFFIIDVAWSGVTGTVFVAQLEVTYNSP